MSKITKILLPLPLLMGSTVLFALDCGYLGITITNHTPNTCILVGADDNGFPVSNVPLRIAPNSTTPIFYIQQIPFAGPKLDLNYHCGPSEAVSFRSQQNYCMLKSGDVYGSVYYGNTHYMDYTAVEGSYRYDAPGIINWFIY